MTDIEPVNAYRELARRFPEIGDAAIAATAIEVLGDRAESAGVAIDRLFSLTRLQGRVDRFLRSVKPRTRKERAREAPPKSSRKG